MSATEVTLRGTVRPDGLIQLDDPHVLPLGPIELKVRISSREATPVKDFMARMQKIWDRQRARGYVARTREEIDADVAALRDEAEEEMQAIERLSEPLRPTEPQNPKADA